MRIIISGLPGAGKSTAAKLLAKQLNLKHLSMGDFQREIAKERNISINELSKLEEKDPTIDKMVDEKQKKLGQNNDNFVLDSRLGAKFIPHADFKVFLFCDFEKRANRIFSMKRAEEAGSLDDIRKKMKEREESEEKRFKQFYNFDYKDKSNYNILVDTTDMNKEETVKKIIERMKN